MSAKWAACLDMSLVCPRNTKWAVGSGRLLRAIATAGCHLTPLVVLVPFMLAEAPTAPSLPPHATLDPRSHTPTLTPESVFLAASL